MVAYSLSTVALVGWIFALLVISFGVSFVGADRLDLSRGGYVAVLTVATAGLWAAVMEWVGPGVAVALRWHWLSGLVLAPVVALVPAVGITRMPATRRRRGRQLVQALGWDAVIYGAAEGLLLSASPAYLAWQAATSAGWSASAADVVAVLASVLVIVVHHLGYPEFRHPRGLVMASTACGFLTVGFLVTGSAWTPVVGHVLMHAAAVVRGNALPPHGDAGPDSDMAASGSPVVAPSGR